MKLTQKDKAFLEALKALMDSKDLWVELKPDRPGYLVLKGTYGQHIHKAFRLSRQGVRWRFWRVFNEMYVSAFETILCIERIFGNQLRDHAIRISKQRYELHQQATQNSFHTADSLNARRHTASKPSNPNKSEL